MKGYLGASFGNEYSLDGKHSQPAAFEGKVWPRGYLGFAKDEDGTIYVVHTCRMGGGAKGVTRENIIAMLKEQGTRFERANWRAPKPIEVALIGRLGDPKLQNDFAKFIRAVRIAKKKPSRWEAFERDGFRCVYCGYDGATSFDAWLNLEVDHFLPAKKGGSNENTNLRTACNLCNGIKGSKPFESLDDARKYVADRRKELRQYWVAMRGINDVG